MSSGQNDENRQPGRSSDQRVKEEVPDPEEDQREQRHPLSNTYPSYTVRGPPGSRPNIHHDPENASHIDISGSVPWIPATPSRPLATRSPNARRHTDTRPSHYTPGPSTSGSNRRKREPSDSAPMLSGSGNGSPPAQVRRLGPMELVRSPRGATPSNGGTLAQRAAARQRRSGSIARPPPSSRLEPAIDFESPTLGVTPGLHLSSNTHWPPLSDTPSASSNIEETAEDVAMPSPPSDVNRSNIITDRGMGSDSHAAEVPVNTGRPRPLLSDLVEPDSLNALHGRSHALNQHRGAPAPVNTSNRAQPANAAQLAEAIVVEDDSPIALAGPDDAAGNIAQLGRSANAPESNPSENHAMRPSESTESNGFVVVPPVVIPPVLRYPSDSTVARPGATTGAHAGNPERPIAPIARDPRRPGAYTGLSNNPDGSTTNRFMGPPVMPSGRGTLDEIRRLGDAAVGRRVVSTPSNAATPGQQRPPPNDPQRRVVSDPLDAVTTTPGRVTRSRHRNNQSLSSAFADMPVGDNGPRSGTPASTGARPSAEPIRQTPDAARTYRNRPVNLLEAELDEVNPESEGPPSYLPPHMGTPVHQRRLMFWQGATHPRSRSESVANSPQPPMTPQVYPNRVERNARLMEMNTPDGPALGVFLDDARPDARVIVERPPGNESTPINFDDSTNRVRFERPTPRALPPVVPAPAFQAADTMPNGHMPAQQTQEPRAVDTMPNGHMPARQTREPEAVDAVPNGHMPARQTPEPRTRRQWAQADRNVNDDARTTRITRGQASPETRAGIYPSVLAAAPPNNVHLVDGSQQGPGPRSSRSSYYNSPYAPHNGQPNGQPNDPPPSWTMADELRTQAWESLEFFRSNTENRELVRMNSFYLIFKTIDTVVTDVTVYTMRQRATLEAFVFRYIMALADPVLGHPLDNATEAQALDFRRRIAWLATVMEGIFGAGNIVVVQLRALWRDMIPWAQPTLHWR